LSAGDFLEKIEQGLVALGQDPDRHPTHLYLAYLDELLRWNKAYNLTAIRDREKMLSHHLLDSLSVLPFLNGEYCLDVGSGAGLPGMILALARPDLKWVLLDSKLKKVRFLQHIVHTLKPANVEIVHSRVEDYHPGQAFTCIITRALTSLHNFYRITGHLRGTGCHLLAMKGKYSDAELSAPGLGACVVHELTVPGLGSERFLIIIKAGNSD
jgi:16S rRNA (guanine527-N7)-methyltransferase